VQTLESLQQLISSWHNSFKKGELMMRRPSGLAQIYFYSNSASSHTLEQHAELGMQLGAALLPIATLCPGSAAATLRRAQLTSPTAAAEDGESALVNGLSLEERFQLCRSIGEECITGVV
jgi:hypothetical protein